MNIELIYFDGCPNVDKARKNLEKAFEEVGRTAQWTEWEQSNPKAPKYIRQYGSPTVLLNGEDIANTAASSSASSCRIYDGGAPSVALIKLKLSGG